MQTHDQAATWLDLSFPDRGRLLGLASTRCRDQLFLPLLPSVACFCLSVVIIPSFRILLLPQAPQDHVIHSSRASTSRFYSSVRVLLRSLTHLSSVSFLCQSPLPLHTRHAHTSSSSSQLGPSLRAASHHHSRSSLTFRLTSCSHNPVHAAHKLPALTPGSTLCTRTQQGEIDQHVTK